jgi:sterol desaturase/sphingolipid hydroxylase (fatty acid hydroxylase superfamily)
MTFRSNYASTFTIWDNVFGTTDSYYQYIKDPKSTLKLLPKEEKDVYKTD